jgi:hypothetical protein
MKIWRALVVTLLLASLCATCGGGQGPKPSGTGYGRAAPSR